MEATLLEESIAAVISLNQTQKESSDTFARSKKKELKRVLSLLLTVILLFGAGRSEFRQRG